LAFIISTYHNAECSECQNKKKRAFKNISKAAVGLNERRESVGNNISSKLWGKESGK